MKRLLVFMTLLALALAWVAPTTAAGTTITMPRITQENYNEGEDLPDDAELFYQWFEKGEDGNWIRRKRDDADKGNARLYVSGENSGNCNAAEWTIDVINHASVAHWCEWQINNTRFDWRILKPGEYAGDGLRLEVWSNGPVSVKASFAEDMPYQNWADIVGEDGSIDAPTIDVFYAWSGKQDLMPEDMDDLDWKTPSEFTETVPLSFTLRDDGWYSMVRLCTKLVVGRDDLSCEYENTGQILLIVENQKKWVAEEVNGGNGDDNGCA
ncbi:MAG: hypothetical protein GX183_00160 [Firmicutes bacterium]|jgi:hypothetical protein|nr:hypothetical protein [Bacillota bacterium]